MSFAAYAPADVFKCGKMPPKGRVIKKRITLCRKPVVEPVFVGLLVIAPNIALEAEHIGGGVRALSDNSGDSGQRVR